MEHPEEYYLVALEGSSVISTPELNLRSKIDSLLRSIENLTQKRIRIEYEIKKQKKSLARKRMELKKNSSSVQKKVSLVLESYTELDDFDETDLRELRRLDSILLEKSNRVLEEL